MSEEPPPPTRRLSDEFPFTLTQENDEGLKEAKHEGIRHRAGQNASSEPTKLSLISKKYNLNGDGFLDDEEQMLRDMDKGECLHEMYGKHNVINLLEKTLLAFCFQFLKVMVLSQRGLQEST